MLAISPALQARFEAYLRNRRVPNKLHGEYKKWLRYYLDFCQKYQISPTKNGSLPRFINIMGSGLEILLYYPLI